MQGATYVNKLRKSNAHKNYVEVVIMVLKTGTMKESENELNIGFMVGPGNNLMIIYLNYINN